MTLARLLDEATRNVAEHVKESGVDTVLVSGRSAPIAVDLFEHGWKEQYDEENMPEIVDLGVKFNQLAYKKYYDVIEEGKEFHRRYIKENERIPRVKDFLKEHFPDLLEEGERLYLDDHSFFGGKMTIFETKMPRFGIKNVQFAVFAATHRLNNYKGVSHIGINNFDLASYFNRVAFDLRDGIYPDLSIIEEVTKKTPERYLN